MTDDEDADYCAFSKNHRCIKWMDYVLARYELEEADQLCHGNWIEVERKYAYIQLLEKTLLANGIKIPDKP